MDIALAVIGGTGVYRLAALEDEQALHCDTPYGAPSGPLRIGHLGNARVAFLARHGEGHALPPHRVNYRANLHALQQAGVRRVLALNTVGGITERFGPRVLACPDQLIDYTWGRESTYWDGEGQALHVDFGQPYSPGTPAIATSTLSSTSWRVMTSSTSGPAPAAQLATMARQA